MSQDNSDRILFLLKTRGALTAAALAKLLRITPMGARQHLARLASDGFVAHADTRSGVGRPKRYWRLTEKGHTRFPDSHAQMTIELLAAVRSVFGAAGLDRLIAERERETLRRYRQAMRGAKTITDRTRKLAALRSEEGYMAECFPAADRSVLLVENHCPVCAAARTCHGLCRSELEIFRTLLPGASIERIDHILAGARRCAYRIAPAPRSRAAAETG
jgi:predicted ArsR family transcriptional regulator